MITYSFIVPIYKVEKYLRKCIDSILKQTYKNFELLLIDDGSPDNCPKICDDYKKIDKRIKVIHKINGGLVSARNVGIQNARGKYICYVDGDDWISPELLENVNNIIEKYNDIDMVFYKIKKIYSDREEIVSCKIKEGYYNKNNLEENFYPYMMYDNRERFCKGLIFPAACNKIYKTELLKKHHCKDERIKMGEDNAFVYECLLYSNNVYFIDKVFYFYNQLNETSFQNRYDADRFKNNKLLYEYIEEHILSNFPNMNDQINAFKVYWLIMAVFHEIKNKKHFFQSRKHIKGELKDTNTLKYVHFNGLPVFAKCYLLLLKMHLYSLSLLGAKVINKMRD